MGATNRTLLDRRGQIRANPPIRRADFLRDALYALIEAPLDDMEDCAKLRGVFLRGEALCG